MTVTVSFDDFKGINKSLESFEKGWKEKGHDDKVRVIALNDKYKDGEVKATGLMVM
jgi:hypothetical protein